MTNLPNVGDRVKVWPMPDRLVQDGPRPVSEGGRFLAKEGREVVWSHAYLDQYRSGDLSLHDPALAPAEAPAEKAKE